MEEQIIIEKALDNLEKQAGIIATWRPQVGEMGGEIEFTYNNETYQIPVEVRKEVRAHQFGRLLRQKKQLEKLMVVAEYVYPKLKEELRMEGIAYLETSGNIFLKTDNFFLWLDNFKTEPKEAIAIGRAFTKTGIKLLFHFLIDETLLNLPYREIARRTGVGFGNINIIMTDLKEQGFLLSINKDKYKFTRKDELLQKWVGAYNEKLKPTLEIGTFRFINKDKYFNWKDVDLMLGETFWGGEPAGGILTDYLQPEQYTLYTVENRGDLIKRYQLAPEKNGDIKVYLKFWKFAEESLKTVPALLVYADLINSNDRRCLQTAERIYDEYLQDRFRAN